MRFDGDQIHVFIDTSTLEKLNFNLDHRKLQKILGADEVTIHTTSVTLHEIRQRMTGLVTQARELSAKTSNKHKLIDWKDTSLTMQSYLKCCKHVHDGKGSDLGRLVELFTGGLPPFSAGKPDQFKDAAAAISLHSWAMSTGKVIYVISEDRDWANVCAAFENFRYCKMADVIGMLYTIHTERAEFDGERIETSIEESEDLAGALEQVSPNGGEGRLSVELGSVSIRVKVSKAKVVGGEIVVTAAFNGFADVALSEWGGSREATTVRIEGFIDAALDNEYKIKELLVTDWYFPAEPLRFAEPEDITVRLPPGDQS